MQLSLMSKVFMNDKGIISRYGSRMSSAMTKEKVECMSAEIEERVWSGECINYVWENCTYV